MEVCHDNEYQGVSSSSPKFATLSRIGRRSGSAARDIHFCLLPLFSLIYWHAILRIIVIPGIISCFSCCHPPPLPSVPTHFEFFRFKTSRWWKGMMHRSETSFRHFKRMQRCRRAYWDLCGASHPVRGRFQHPKGLAGATGLLFFVETCAKGEDGKT